MPEVAVPEHKAKIVRHAISQPCTERCDDIADPGEKACAQAAVSRVDPPSV
jgi:hypothetical protein